MTIGLPDVPDTRKWQSWGDHYLINEWRANGGPEQLLNNIVQGLQFKPNGVGLTGHEVTPGVANINGYRVKYVGGDTFDFVASNYYTFWAKLNLDPDVEAGYENAYITIQVQGNAGSLYDGDPPAGDVILLGYIVVGAGSPYLSATGIVWHSNFPSMPEVHIGDVAAYKDFHTFNKEILSPPTGMSSAWTPILYYKMGEGVSASLMDEGYALDPIDAAAGTKYVRPVKARNRLGQLFDAYLGGTGSYRMSVNPTRLKAEGLPPFTDGYIFSVWAFPFRDDIDMYLMYKDQDFYLKWDAALKVLEFKVGDGLGSMVRFVQSQTIASFKDMWFNIMFGYNNTTNKHYMVVNDEAMQIEIGTGARGVAATDFYMGSSNVPDTNYYGILDEFCKFAFDGGYHRLFIHEFNNYGVGLEYIGEGEGNRKSLIQLSTYGVGVAPSVGAGAEAQMTFGNPIVDPGGWVSKYFDQTLYRFIAPRAMTVFAYAKVTLDDPVAGGLYHITFKISGSARQRAYFHAVDGDDLTLQLSGAIPLMAGEYLEVFVWNYTGSAVQTILNVSNGEFAVIQMS